MTAPEIVFAAPRSLSDALAELAAGDDALALAGGTALGLLLRHRLIEPATIVSLARVPELAGISHGDGGDLRIGAMTTLRDCAASPAVRAHAPLLAYAASLVGNPRVRAVATIGGALAHSDPRQDLPPVLLALGARVRLVTSSGSRELPLAAFFRGFMETALSEGELIQEVIIPALARRRFSYRRFAPGSQDDFPAVAVAVSLLLAADGTVEEAAIALGAGGTRARLAGEAAAVLVGKRPSPADLDFVADAVAVSSAPVSDRHGDASYKRDMIRLSARRALADCL